MDNLELGYYIGGIPPVRPEESPVVGKGRNRRNGDSMTAKKKKTAPKRAPKKKPVVRQEEDDAVVPEVVLEPEVEGAEVNLEVSAVPSVAKKAPAAAKKRDALVPLDPLQLYLAEVRQYPLLTREEEHEVAVQYQDSEDPDLAFKLVTANLRIVVKIAMEFRRSFINLLDLIQEGNIGLMHAVKKFDPYKGTRLSYFASWWIRAYIIRYLLNNWRLVKIGTTQAQRKLFFNLKKERTRLESLGFNPTPRLLASTLDVKEEEVIEMSQRLDGGEVSLDLPAFDDSRATISEQISNNDASQEDLLADAQLKALLREKVSEFQKDLKEREQRVLQARLLSEEPLTLQTLGDEMGVTRERVRQIEERLLKKLRQRLKADLEIDID